MDSHVEQQKDIERTYYAQIGRDGMRHALAKPFVDDSRAQLLFEFSAVLSVMPPPPARIIDLGCGTGWTTDFLARAGYDATGVDLSPEAIDAATTTYGRDNARFVVRDYEEALDEAGTYDLALFFDALHHCVDLDAALRAAATALKPGGVCVVSEPGRGHAHSPGSVEAREHFGVTERDMPPDLVLKHARTVGFRAGRVYPFPAEVQQLLYPVAASGRTGMRKLLDTRPGGWFLMARAMNFRGSRHGLVRLER